jgi:hypothetical protein
MLSPAQLERATEWYRRGYLEATSITIRDNVIVGWGKCLPKPSWEVGQPGTFSHHDYYQGLEAGVADVAGLEKMMARSQKKEILCLSNQSNTL